MLSEQKVFLKFAELIAVFGAGGSMFIAFHFYRAPQPNISIEFLFIIAFGMLAFSFLPVCVLGSEYARTVRKSSNFGARANGLNAGELAALMHWAPLTYKLVAGLGIAVMVATAIAFGEISWSSEDPPTSEDGVASALYLGAFFLLTLPVLGSACRMPGAYAENFRTDQT